MSLEVALDLALCGMLLAVLSFLAQHPLAQIREQATAGGEWCKRSDGLRL